MIPMIPRITMTDAFNIAAFIPSGRVSAVAISRQLLIIANHPADRPRGERKKTNLVGLCEIQESLIMLLAARIDVLSEVSSIALHG